MTKSLIPLFFALAFARNANDVLGFGLLALSALAEGSKALSEAKPHVVSFDFLFSHVIHYSGYGSCRFPEVAGSDN